jgi:hypothetical protein
LASVGVPARRIVAILTQIPSTFRPLRAY